MEVPMPVSRSLLIAIVGFVVGTPLAGEQVRYVTERDTLPLRPSAVKPFDKTALDTTCAPCKDFFQFANGGWIARTEIPAAYASWGSFSELDDRNKTVLRAV